MHSFAHPIRRAVRQEEIHARLRDRILSGELRPGRRLPAFAELEKQFGAAERTIERAIRQLAEEGFVRVRAKVGTFVSEFPPHLWRYGMVFHNHPDRAREHWSRFYRAVLLAVEAFNRRGEPRQIECFYDCGGHTDGEGYQRLVRDLEARRLAGLMFAFSPWPLNGMPPVQAPGVPRVAFNAAERTFPSVGMNGQLLIDRALDRFLELGRRNVAFLGTPGTTDTQLAYFQAGVMRRGMRSLPFWIYPVDPHATRWVRHAVHAILRSDASLAPDALFVSDDHLTEPLADALESLDVRVPRDLEVISHWNFPNPFTRRQPFHLVGPDAAELLTRWLDTIDMIRRGEKAPEREMVAPVFNEEWAGRQQANEAAKTKE